MGSGFGGMIFSLATGLVVDHYSFTPVFFGFGLLPLIAATIVWTLPPSVRRPLDIRRAEP
jgi:ACS family hexuronate transporter-like MFS transporter